MYHIIKFSLQKLPEKIPDLLPENLSQTVVQIWEVSICEYNNPQKQQREPHIRRLRNPAHHEHKPGTRHDAHVYVLHVYIFITINSLPTMLYVITYILPSH